MGTQKRTRRILGAVVAAIAFFMVGQYVDAERPQYGSLVRARGVVEYRAAGTEKWVTSTERQRVAQGDRFKTGPDGEAVIRMSDRNIIAVRANSEVTINMARTQSGVDPNNKAFGLFPARVQVQNMEVGLDHGRAINVLKGLHGGSQFRMSTPVAVAGVRGTIFMAEVGPPAPARGAKQGGSSNVEARFACIEGSVHVDPTTPGAFTPTDVNAGQMFAVTTTPGGAAVPGGVQSAPVSGDVQTDINSAVNSVQTELSDVKEPDISGPEPPTSSGCHYY